MAWDMGGPEERCGGRREAGNLGKGMGWCKGPARSAGRGDGLKTRRWNGTQSAFADCGTANVASSDRT